MCVCVYRKDAHAKTLNGTLPLINPRCICLLYSSSFHLSVSSSLPLPIPPNVSPLLLACTALSNFVSRARAASLLSAL